MGKSISNALSFVITRHHEIQGGSNMTGTDLCVNKPHCAAAVQCGLFTYKSVPVIFEPPCIMTIQIKRIKQAEHIQYHGLCGLSLVIKIKLISSLRIYKCKKIVGKELENLQ